VCYTAFLTVARKEEVKKLGKERIGIR